MEHTSQLVMDPKKDCLDTNVDHIFFKYLAIYYLMISFLELAL